MMMFSCLCCTQGSARKTGPWDDEEAAALTREVQKYMEVKQGARAQRASMPGQVCLGFALCVRCVVANVLTKM